LNILYLGDIVGKSGRSALLHALPILKEKYAPECIIVNAENAAGGFGLTPKLCEEFFGLGIDVITTGNHIWDKKEIIPYIVQEHRLIRPLNYPQHNPGRGATLITTKRGYSVLVMNVMGRVFMDPLDDPFAAVEKELASVVLGQTVDAIVVDIHAETTSEKMAMGHFCDGRVSFVVGSHTHIPTADAMILEKGTAYQSDAGMCGDYNSVIGIEKEEPLERFVNKMHTGRYQVSTGEGTACGVVVKLNSKTGLAENIVPVRLGAWLRKSLPEI
jgi:2',3'-cyclic-nucleotide 2'-phosphodiesterase